MEKFLVMFLAPASVMAEWMKKPEEERKIEEQNFGIPEASIEVMSIRKM